MDVFSFRETFEGTGIENTHKLISRVSGEELHEN